METEQSPPVLLYVGAGSHRIDGFMHAEISVFKQFKGGGDVGPPDMLCDIADHIPLPDASVDFVYSRGTFEHLTYRELTNHLLECWRIVKPGGFVRADVPDFDRFIAEYHDEVFHTGPEWVEPDPDFPVHDHVEFFIQRVMFHDHRYLHNFHTLSGFLSRAGFTQIVRCDEGQTRFDPVSDRMAETEHGQVEGGVHVIVEAVRGTDPPTATRYPRVWPRRRFPRMLAQRFNIRLESFIRSRPRFPSRRWFREKRMGFGNPPKQIGDKAL